jgi:selenoprotein W-related protein
VRARLNELVAAAEVELVESSGGVFEISRDGRLLFSKKQLGRFPTDAEVDALATDR